LAGISKDSGDNGDGVYALEDIKEFRTCGGIIDKRDDEG
jgi:hypothetical protein